MKQWKGWLCGITAATMMLTGWTGTGIAQAETDEAGLLAYEGAGHLDVRLIARYTSGAALDEGGTEIVAYDAATRKAFSVNGAETALDILDLSGLKSGQAFGEVTRTHRIGLEDIAGVSEGVKDITSVAKSPTDAYIAVSVVADPKTDPGKVVFLDLDGAFLGQVQVGSLPDMVTFTPDGSMVLVANEGEPNDDYSVDPAGSVSIIDVSGGMDSLDGAEVTTVGFEDVDTSELYVVKPDATFAVDAEPEYIVAATDSKSAYVVMQESSAMGVLNLESMSFDSIVDLGVKDHSVEGNELDASNKDDAINMQRYPLLGMYQPDSMSLFNIDGQDYIITANEGDAKEYEAFAEESRVEDEVDNIALNAEYYEGYTQAELDALVAGGLFEEDQMGRIKITTSRGKNADGKFEALYSYGARSFSIWNADDMSLVYDSGSELESIVARAIPDQFNADNVENGADDRSDDKGPETEAATIGQVGDKTYAFVGLERVGGIAIYNVENPMLPVFEGYYNSRDFSGEEAGGDSAPEGLAFIAADQSPTGTALLLAAHEVTGTIAVYEIVEQEETKTITILHTNDSHGRAIEADFDGMGFAKLSTLVKEYEAKNSNTLLLDAGDTFHGTNFATLVQGESIAKVMNEVGYDGMAAGNHDFNYGYERLLELEQMITFPLVSANVVKEDGSLLLDPYFIKEVDGVKLGIFGLSTPETHYKTHPKNVEGLTFTDPVAAAQKMVAELQGLEVDVIIAVTHLGIDESSTDTSIKVAEGAPGIDLIVDGHSHTTLVEGLEGANDTLIVSAGEYTKNLGVVELTFEEDKLVGKSASLITKEQAATITPDPAVEAVIKEISASQEVVLEEVIGKTAVKLDGERELVRAGETNLGNLITDAMLHVSGADVALTNGGGIRASIEIGDITKGDVITVLPFGNYIVTKEVTGAELKAALENGAKSYPATLGAFGHVGGMSYKIDESKAAGERVHSVMVKGQPLDMNKTYVLATNDFMAAGGDEYTMFSDNAIVNEFPALDEAVIDYIQHMGEVNVKAEGRITVEAVAVQAPVAKPVPAPSPSGTEDYVVQAGDTLWAIARKYKLTWEKLQEVNKLTNPNLIFPGQRILIP